MKKQIKNWRRHTKNREIGALTGHLMHALKTPLSQLQLIVGEARENKDINPKELEMIQIECDLVSQSLQSSRNRKPEEVCIQMSREKFFNQ